MFWAFSRIKEIQQRLNAFLQSQEIFCLSCVVAKDFWELGNSEINGIKIKRSASLLKVKTWRKTTYKSKKNQGIAGEKALFESFTVELV